MQRFAYVFIIYFTFPLFQEDLGHETKPRETWILCLFHFIKIFYHSFLPSSRGRDPSSLAALLGCVPAKAWFLYMRLSNSDSNSIFFFFFTQRPEPEDRRARGGAARPSLPRWQWQLFFLSRHWSPVSGAEVQQFTLGMLNLNKSSLAFYAPSVVFFTHVFAKA